MDCLVPVESKSEGSSWGSGRGGSGQGPEGGGAIKTTEEHKSNFITSDSLTLSRLESIQQ